MRTVGAGGARLRDLPVQEVRGADEPRDELGRRPLVDLGRRPHLLDPTGSHDGDAVGDRHRLLLVVGDVGDREAELALKPLDLVAHEHPEVGVEIRQRLVEEEHAGPHAQRAGQRDALLLAAGQLIRAAIPEPFQAHDAQEVLHARGDLAARAAPDAERIPHVAGHRQVREERVALEDHRGGPPIRRIPRHVLPVEPDPAGVRADEPAGHAQEGRLAAAARADERDQLAFPDLGVDTVDGHDGAVALGQPLQPEDGAHRATPAARVLIRRPRACGLIGPSRARTGRSAGRPSTGGPGRRGPRRSAGATGRRRVPARPCARTRR